MPTLARAPMAPGDLTVARGQHTVKADLGTFCISSEPAPDGTVTSLCSDAAAPTEAPRPRLPVRAGARLRVQLADRPGVQDTEPKLRVALARFRDNGRYDFLGVRPHLRREGDRAWSTRLPTAVRRADAIDFAVRFTHGDAYYIAGIK